MRRTMTTLWGAAAAAAALSLTACGPKDEPEPANEATAAEMPGQGAVDANQTATPAAEDGSGAGGVNTNSQVTGTNEATAPTVGVPAGSMPVERQGSASDPANVGQRQDAPVTTPQ